MFPQSSRIPFCSTVFNCLVLVFALSSKSRAWISKWWSTACFQWSIFFSFIFISWKLTTLQYCSGFCHTLTWISQGFTCVPHPDPPSQVPPHPIPLGLPSAPSPCILSTCLMHPAWAGDLFHTWWHTCFNAVLSEHPTLAFSYRVPVSVLYIKFLKNYFSCSFNWKWKLLSRVQLFVTPQTIASQAPLSMGFSRQDYWSGFPFPSPEDLLDPGMEPKSPVSQEDSLPFEPQGKSY